MSYNDDCHTWIQLCTLVPRVQLLDETGSIMAGCLLCVSIPSHMVVVDFSTFVAPMGVRGY